MNDYSSLPHRLNGRSIFRVLFSALTLAVGLVLAAGGLRLITLGGSSYYALAGVAYVILAFLYLKRHHAALHLTIAIFGATVIWALFDTPEFGFWALLPRLVVPALMFGLGLWASATLEAVPAKLRSASFWGGAATAGALILTLISAFFPHGAIYEPGNLSAQTPLALDKIDAPGNWAMFGRNANGTRFAPFNDINLENVSDLQVAWTYRTGRRTTGAGIGVDENTPLQIGNILYSCTPENMVTALDADTGKALWKFDPHAHSAEHVTCRGVGYYDVDADTRLTPSQKAALPDGICRQRLLISTVDARLIAIDAATGKPCADFGKGGTVDLAPGMGPVEQGKRYHPTSVPVLMGHVAVVGGWVRDIVHGEPSGAVRAYDALTGKLAWVWDVGSPDNAVAAQQNPQFSLETPNVWTVPTYDRDLNLVYLPTGAGPPDYWGGDRNQAKEKFGAAIVAVDASTGRTRWVYQTVHHDVWDYDVPSQPVLYDVTNDKGLKVPALIQTTKMGNIFVLDRRTGKPVTRVVERAVTNNPAAEGDRLSPTQPFSVGMPIIGNDRLSERKMWGVSTFDQLYCRIMFKDSVYTGAFTPPGEKPYIEYPSLLGGMNWGGVSIDETRDLMFVNDMRVPLRMMLVNEKNAGKYKISMDEVPGFMGTLRPQVAGPYRGVRIDVLQSPLAVPCNTPPFGTMTAIDLKTKKIVWQVPLGTVRDTGPMGIKTHLPIPLGMPTLGGPTSTASGLVFFAGTQDNYLRALDSLTGKEVWKARLPAGAPAAPLIYRSPRTGRQYVVISVGGMSHAADVGDYIIAYALPQKGLAAR
ncbi:membrane-bound PQQ-dependent dehydrogenase, glucose/quinate/shikimate family [Sphingobium sp. WW5]|uniref:membrane-bound PQQ-dependent dehydrogenase, glucose/quinate/shikimate family n=1 Tax=unclassified Sphingobium TaxID=2611147 RepID=UPI003C140F11